MKKIKWIGMFAALLCAALLVTSCGSGTDENNANGEVQPGNSISNSVLNGSKDDTDPAIDIENSLFIKLDDGKTDVGNSGATYADGVLTINKAGTYRLQGKLTDGQVYVSVDKTEIVDLILDGVDITCNTSAAIYCDSADKLYISTNAGSKNKLSDGYNYVYEQAGSDEPNACIFSSDDITIRGAGALTVNGNFKNGISSKNDIKIKDLTLVVNAANTGIRGKDSVKINSGVVTVDAKKDGLKASQTEKADKGFVEINGGKVTITAGDDAIQAVLMIAFNGGEVTTNAEGKAANCDTEGGIIYGEGCKLTTG